MRYEVIEDICPLAFSLITPENSVPLSTTAAGPVMLFFLQLLNFYIWFTFPGFSVHPEAIAGSAWNMNHLKIPKM